MLNEALVLLEIVLLSAALPLAVVAAYGFRDSPFGRVTSPIPVVLVCYIAADGSRLLYGHVPPVTYAVLTSVAVAAAVYAALNATLLLTERRSV